MFGYFPSWSIYFRNYTVDQIPGQYYTHILYAFANISNFEIALADPWADIGQTAEQKQSPTNNNGANSSYAGNFKKLRELKQKFPHLKTLISIGGWTLSSQFSVTASTEGYRRKFAKSIAAFIQKYGFDGVDLDWEYPVEGGNNIPHRPDDGQNFLKMVMLIRECLDELPSGKYYLITGAFPANLKYAANYPLAQLAGYMDFFNIMAYDFKVGTEPTTGHASNVFGKAETDFSANSAVQYYMKYVQPSQLVLGFPMYGQAWANVSSEKYSLNLPSTGPALGTGNEYNGALDFKDVRKMISDKSMYVYIDKTLQASWTYNSGTRTMISFDHPWVVQKKAEYVNKWGLAGMMAWQIAGDTKELAHTAFTGLDMRRYPQYDYGCTYCFPSVEYFIML